MSHISPASFLVWSVMCFILGVFLVFHLWSFDRFQCLRWNTGPSGTFKRVMTYSYLLTIPLLTIYSVGFAIIKYHEGLINYPPFGVIPKPYQLWAPSTRNAIFPLTFTFSIGWSLEMVTHLEELCFWLFLVNSGSSKRNWFQGLYFKSWVVGSVTAVICMPLVTTFTRSDPLKGEAYTFLMGGLGDLLLTLWFIPILIMFPAFLRNLRAEGVDTKTMVRLTKNLELNSIRIVFRFLFVIPILILAVDGIRPHQHVNENMFATDFLAILAGFGMSISSGITLVIFFPRSIEGEMAERDAMRASKRSASSTDSRFQTNTKMSQMVQSTPTSDEIYHGVTPKPAPYLPASLPVKEDNQWIPEQYPLHTEQNQDARISNTSTSNLSDQHWDEEEELDTVAPLAPIRPNRRRGNDAQQGGIDFVLTESHFPKLKKDPNVNPLLHNFTSPINFESAFIQNRSSDSWLTFYRR